MLLDDWSEYDNKKTRANQDVFYVDFSNQWEVEYIIEKIKKFNPNTSSGQIIDAITACYLKLSNLIHRKECLEYIMHIIEKPSISKSTKSKIKAQNL